MTTIVNFVCGMIIFLSEFMVATNFKRKQIPFYFFIREFYPCFIDGNCPRNMCKVYQIPKCVGGLCRCIPLRCGRWEK
ncbi:putative Late nodulin [Medicago truncatula]|uniref:Putative Late nodulin n=1 Tax=Medicago truncatula TaxID=3880 RepID=A0A396IQI6_MEDTR|nr:putative Late nodulin [Medicago truncatula]